MDLTVHKTGILSTYHRYDPAQDISLRQLLMCDLKIFQCRFRQHRLSQKSHHTIVQFLSGHLQLIVKIISINI